jgi:hypothetical protein
MHLASSPASSKLAIRIHDFHVLLLPQISAHGVTFPGKSFLSDVSLLECIALTWMPIAAAMGLSICSRQEAV